MSIHQPLAHGNITQYLTAGVYLAQWPILKGRKISGMSHTGLIHQFFFFFELVKPVWGDTSGEMVAMTNEACLGMGILENPFFNTLVLVVVISWENNTQLWTLLGHRVSVLITEGVLISRVK